MSSDDKKKFKKWRDKWRKKFPEKRRANKAASSIPLIKGFTRHHWSYNEDYHKDIIWIPFIEHKTVHMNIIKYDPASKLYRTADGELLTSKEEYLNYINKFINESAFI